MKRDRFLQNVPDRLDRLVDTVAAEERVAAEFEELPSFIDLAPVFLDAEDVPLEYIIPEITPRGVLKLSHGDPRTMKSLAVLEEAIAAATATPAFGMERFRPSRKYRVLYLSQEDGASLVRPRVKALLRARNIETFPEDLGFGVFKGVDLDSPEWQQRLFDEVLLYGFELVTIDPLRGFTAFADGSPKEVMPIAKFLRRFTVRGITAHLTHHDTKPPVGGPDNRRRSHKASGGAWFSVSECPVSFEKIGDGQSLVTPEDFKHSRDPLPFTIRYTEEDDGRIIRLVGETVTSDDAKGLAAQEKILGYLSEHPGGSGSAISKAIRLRKDTVLSELDALLNAGKVDSTTKGRSTLWFLRKESS